MNSSEAGLPAILGGRPVRPAGPPGWPRADESVRDVLRAMIESGDWGRYHGPHVPSLCQQLAEYHAVEHVLACSSGTSAVELALRGVGVQEGDEVILAAYDFKANFQNVLHLKAIPVLVDVDPVNFQLDPNQLESAITAKTRAIVMSHLHGGVVDAPTIRQIADAHRITIVEDACQNPGAVLFGRKAGTWGDIGVLSFGGSKLLTAGRGGAVLTQKSEIAERIKRHVLRGNDVYPLSEIQAAILCPQMDQLDATNEQRRNSVDFLALHLESVPGLTPLQLPTATVQPAYYKVGFRYDGVAFGGLSRDLFVESLRAEGIAMDAGFRSNHLIHASRRFRSVGELPVATKADREMVTLYHPVLLESESTISEIALAVHKAEVHCDAITMNSQR